MKKIAFCFFTYDNFHNLEIWENFFKAADPKKYTIIVSALHPEKITQDFLKKYLVEQHCQPKYAHISQDRAMFYLLTTAFEDSDIHLALNLTGSCIPLVSFDNIYDTLINIDKGFLNWINAIDDPDPEYLRRQGELKDVTFVSHEKWVRHFCYGIGFSRELLQFLIDNDHTDLFENVRGTVEHYVGNVLVHHGKEELVIPRSLLYNHAIGGPYGGLPGITAKQVEALRANGYLFFRKLQPNAHIPDMCIQPGSKPYMFVEQSKNFHLFFNLLRTVHDKM
jgi:hypothetical protein